MRALSSTFALTVISSTTIAILLRPCSSFSVPPSVSSIPSFRRASVGRCRNPSTRTGTRTSSSLGGSSLTNYEELSRRLPSKAVIDAVESSSGVVVASDVAASAGVSLSQARKDLTALASLSRGDVSVSPDGELIYRFPNNLSSVLSSNSLKFRATSLARKAWPPLFYAVRVSFGAALLISIFAIFSTIAVVGSGGGGDGDRDDRDRGDSRRGGGGGGGGGFGLNFFGPSPFDVFYYRPYYGYYAPYGSYSSYRDPEEMGFLESVFSYVFGDGDPNRGVEEYQLRAVSRLVRDNGGAVTAEQLAPFVLGDDLPAFDDDAAEADDVVDESYVLPLVASLEGEPVVTEEGDIVYVFPELTKSADATATATTDASATLGRAGLPPDASGREIRAALASRGVDPRYAGRGTEKAELLRLLRDVVDDDDDENENDGVLEERESEFSVATDLNRVLAGALGVVNLGGALYLGNLLSSPALVGARLPSYFGLVQAGFPLLLGYAVLYNLVPLGRSFWLRNKNEGVRRRNKRRREWRARVLAATSGRIGRKLRRAREMARSTRILREDDAVYSTRRSTAADLEAERERDSMREFDRVLGAETTTDGDDAANKSFE